jgi:hypothetical protein
MLDVAGTCRLQRCLQGASTSQQRPSLRDQLPSRTAPTSALYRESPRQSAIRQASVSEPVPLQARLGSLGALRNPLVRNLPGVKVVAEHPKYSNSSLIALGTSFNALGPWSAHSARGALALALNRCYADLPYKRFSRQVVIDLAINQVECHQQGIIWDLPRTLRLLSLCILTCRGFLCIVCVLAKTGSMDIIGDRWNCTE